MEMEIPVIDFSKLGSQKRSETMAVLHEACEKWGFFMVKKASRNTHQLCIHNRWGSIESLLKKNHIIEAFAGSKGPSVGTKVAMYPECPRPELIRGLREHTDAGGIILLLQDEQVPGLEFFKDGKWVKIPPSKNNRMFINTGDQIEILSNGVYKSALHRVMAMKDGNRLSIATFYNPCGDAVISPASGLLLPDHIRFEDYLNFYTKTKFGDKGLRFQSIKNMTNGFKGSLNAEN